MTTYPGHASGRPAVLRDVARLARVSAQTVSRVVHAHPRVRPETRARVLAAMRALRYQPNHAARTLVTRRSGIIGLVTFPATPTDSAALVHAVEGAAADAGYRVSVTDCAHPDETSLHAALDRLYDQAVEGVVLITPSTLAGRVLAAAPRVPVVAAGDLRQLPSAAVDNALGARLITRHLLDLGHHTVHHVHGPAGHPEAMQRCSGWRRTLLTVRRPVPAPLAGDGAARSGYLAGLRLAADPTVTAVFCGTDQMAVGVLRALTEAGRDVPGQVSVAGFGDVPESAYLRPPLTTVRQDLTATGGDSVTLLLDLIAGGAPVHRRHPPVLVERDSTAPVNAGTAAAAGARSRRGTAR